MPDGTILTMKDVVDGALTVAISKIGVREDPLGSNSGPDVDQFLASVGLPPGNEWCASFGFYCYKRSVEILSVSVGFKLTNPCPRTASVIRMWEQIDDKYKSMTPQRGSLYFVNHGKRRGHMGFVIDVEPDGKVDECSGNTNQEGARTGTTVWRHSFRLTDPKVHGGALLGFAYFGETAVSV